jgi:3-(3-hydroxy-phenyl)propionate hydroxylase
MGHYQLHRFTSPTPPELRGLQPGPYPVAIIGAGPVGLAAAIDLALQGVPTVVLDDSDRVSVGSRAICWAKRTLEIFDRLGIGARMVEKGITWKLGRLFHAGRELYSFDLLPEPGHKMPAFINLQQYYVEQYLVERCADFPDLIDLRWNNKLAALTQTTEAATLTIETPAGAYTLTAAWVIACDGARSRTRSLLGLDFSGRVFEERFLIADVEMKADFPAERWFWFEPPFHSGQSALLHKQPDDIYRIDLQLGPDADPEAEKQPERVIPRIRAIVGERPFTLDWVSVYNFQCRRLEKFVHNRVIFAGDSAHIVSPFGARGGNGGIQDVDNLAWKLAAIVQGTAGGELLASYDEERIFGADENIRHSARSTNFMTPKSETERVFRRAVLDLAGTYLFARRMVNSGRLSAPCSLAGGALQTPAEAGRGAAPGQVCPDAPLIAPDGKPLFLSNLLGQSFKLLVVGDLDPPAGIGLPVIKIGAAGFADPDGFATARLGRDVLYLIRPDQHVAARFNAPTFAAVSQALRRAKGLADAAAQVAA